jgi:hypothetical protein
VLILSKCSPRSMSTFTICSDVDPCHGWGAVLSGAPRSKPFTLTEEGPQASIDSPGSRHRIQLTLEALSAKGGIGAPQLCLTG